MTKTPPFKLVLMGASGRVGRTILATLREAENAPLWNLVATPDPRTREGDSLLDTINARAEAFSGADVVIDFSHGSQAEANVRAATRAGIPCLIGTTELPDEAAVAVDEAIKSIPVLFAPNASRAVAVLAQLVAEAARRLPDSWDIEILDFHHAAKRDAPSGTAKSLELVLQDVRHEKAPDHPTLKTSRKLVQGKEKEEEDSNRERHPGVVNTTSFREGTTAGEHRIIFTGYGERLELHHIAHDRTPYARGALHHAQNLINSSPGFYTPTSLVTLEGNSPATRTLYRVSSVPKLH